MADQRLTDKSALSTAADGDYLEIVDVSDTSANAAGTTKKITKANLVGTPFAGAFTDLSDVDETSATLLTSVGRVPMVTVDESTEPNTTKLKFERLPTFTDLLGGNAIVKGGIVYSGTGLTYRAWATSYIINGRYIDIPVSADVTQTTADATNPRIDVFVVEVTTAEPPVPSIVIVAGTPAASPVKPSIDLSTQVEISFRTIAALATTDTDAVTEVIYDENLGETAEWDLTDTPTGANMADTTDPKVGTVSITLPAYSSDVLGFTKDAVYTYVAAEVLSFYMRITTGLTPKSNLQFRLKNGTDYWNFNSKIVNLIDYGYVQSDTDWQLIQIPLSSFSANSRSITQYDEFELTFTDTPIIEIDWIVIQGSVINPSDLPLLEVVAGTGVTVDSSDSQRPIVSITDTERIQNTTVSLSAAQIKSIASANIEAVANPGAGKFIRILSAVWNYTYGTAPFDAITLRLDQTCDAGYATCPFSMDTGFSRNREGTYALNQDFCPNSNLYIDAGADSVATGDGTMKVYISYQIITV
tara:strand:+ start:6054 stop:7637 length:1584 start_codon:yes stop_codon:yes gene_type:complete